MQARYRKRGFAMLELLGALALGGVLIAGLATLVGGSVEDLRQQQTAAYQQRFASAAAAYLRANYGPLLQAAADAASGTTTVSVAQLKAAGSGFLPASFAATNPYSQTPCLLVRRSGSTLTGLAATEGGQTIDDKGLAYVAAHAGPGAGFIKLLANAPGPAAGGAFGSWKLDATALAAYASAKCSGTAAAGGHLATALFADAGGQVPTDFLYRDPVAGRPELNQMNAPLRMAGSGLVKTGAACDGRAQIAIDADRNLVTCGLDSTWKNSGNNTWREPVASFAALQALAGEPDGTVRVTLDTSRAFVHSGTSWLALAVDQNGNLAVKNRISAASGSISGDVTVGGDLHVGNDVTANNGNVTGGVYASSLEASAFMYSPAFEFEYTGTPSSGDYATPGKTCNIELAPVNGVVPVIYPVGTQLPDRNGITMICHLPEKQFKYENGTSTP